MGYTDLVKSHYIPSYGITGFLCYTRTVEIEQRIIRLIIRHNAGEIVRMTVQTQQIFNMMAEIMTNNYLVLDIAIGSIEQIAHFVAQVRPMGRVIKHRVHEFRTQIESYRSTQFDTLILCFPDSLRQHLQARKNDLLLIPQRSTGRVHLIEHTAPVFTTRVG